MAHDGAGAGPHHLDDYPEYYRGIFTAGDHDFLRETGVAAGRQRAVIQALCLARLATFALGVFLAVAPYDRHEDSWLWPFLSIGALAVSLDLGESSRRLRSGSPFLYGVATARASGAAVGLLLLAARRSAPDVFAFVEGLPAWVVLPVLPLPLLFGSLSYAVSRRFVWDLARRDRKAFAWLRERRFIKPDGVPVARPPKRNASQRGG